MLAPRRATRRLAMCDLGMQFFFSLLLLSVSLSSRFVCVFVGKFARTRAAFFLGFAWSLMASYIGVLCWAVLRCAAIFANIGGTDGVCAYSLILPLCICVCEHSNRSFACIIFLLNVRNYFKYRKWKPQRRKSKTLDPNTESRWETGKIVYAFHCKPQPIIVFGIFCFNAVFFIGNEHLPMPSN